MKKLKLHNSEISVSQLGLGCINFGTTTSEENAFDLIETYLLNGGNYLDTANNYAFWNGDYNRPSERTIGKWIKNNPSVRSKFYLGTKLGALPNNIDAGFSDMQGTSAEVVYSEVQKSLETLKTDYIDILFLHIDDRKTPVEETMSALQNVMNKGYVKAIGCSNFQTWRIQEYRNVCEKNGFPFFSAVQQRNSYFKPVSDADFGVQISADSSLFDYLNYHKDLTLFSHTSLLYGAYLKETIDDLNYDTKQNNEKLEKLKLIENRIPYVLKEISNDAGGNIVLSTTSNTKHLLENIKIFA
ncbi:MAG: aldo/keto reductase [Treponema sp.]|uniref:aldo/keto reductase n=1 Tax=Treponema sp. TaxID=166 RepID=UPI00298DBB53|nr:aldo/keto reductase [Treponema sp.]MCQ2601706.1 aldo/keto reductase [Treponema sp.]